MPLGSSFENTKQLNAARNCSPQGPWAMPPRQGQSQFISPVSSLKAPSWEASSSVSSSCPGSTAAVVVWADEGESMGELEGEGLG